MVFLFSQLLFTGIGHSQPPPQHASLYLLYMVQTLFLRWQQIFLEIFIVKQWQFPCIIGSGGGCGGEIQWAIARHPRWVASIYFTYNILNQIRIWISILCIPIICYSYSIAVITPYLTHYCHSETITRGNFQFEIHHRPSYFLKNRNISDHVGGRPF